MKSIQQIKKELHEYIDCINDEKKLLEVYENTLKYSQNSSQNNESDSQVTMPYQDKGVPSRWDDQGQPRESESEKEARKVLARWFSDGGKNAC